MTQNGRLKLASKEGTPVPSKLTSKKRRYVVMPETLASKEGTPVIPTSEGGREGMFNSEGVENKTPNEINNASISSKREQR